MYNDWLTIGPLTIHGYGVMIAIGILCAFWLGERQARRRKTCERQTLHEVFSGQMPGALLRPLHAERIPRPCGCTSRLFWF